MVWRLTKRYQGQHQARQGAHVSGDCEHFPGPVHLCKILDGKEEGLMRDGLERGVGLADATRWLRHGQLVATVHGTLVDLNGILASLTAVSSEIRR